MKKNVRLDCLFQLEGHPDGGYTLTEKACQETQERRGIIVYLEANWKYLKIECNMDFSDFGVGDSGVFRTVCMNTSKMRIRTEHVPL